MGKVEEGAEEGLASAFLARKTIHLLSAGQASRASASPYICPIV